MKALIVADRDGWSYMQIAKAIQRHNTDPDLQIDVMALKGNEREFLSRQSGYDRCLIMGHQMVEGLLGWAGRIPRHWLTGIHSAHAFDPELRTSPDYNQPPPNRLLAMLTGFRAVNAVSLRLHRLFLDYGLWTHPTQNGVDPDVFKPTRRLSTDGSLIVGCAYTPKHDTRKGVSEFIRPACKKVGAVFVEAKARSDQHVPPENMPGWMNTIGCYVCASSSEGFSIAVLEAAACGRLCISTRVGGSTELIEDGVNGFLVHRTVEAIADRLAWVRDHRTEAAVMARNMRADVEARWSWAVRAPDWLRFLTES